ncbi:Uncharacterised protein [Listeria grayi]|uniref:Uncharacterized protein n=1 Tax=Listeria grayi FSL F6-1183 TaxID=1265827 RepID=A0A829RBW6_LISGR|nr:hypothetical protein [Listeria grayi]EUJ30665.1 hypothetical protein LMUR_00030 [Listeria grayi FSL F6-1183]MBC1921678.1 hypothetical protein [Listeria grayi]VEI31561.1 Uncharacterised protein [Listeria grayi]
MKRFFWSGLLLLAILLFLVALRTELLYLNLIVILLALLIYSKGSPILFEKYYKRRERLRNEYVERMAKRNKI